MAENRAESFDAEFNEIMPFLSILKNNDKERLFRQEVLPNHRVLVSKLCAVVIVSLPVFMLTDNMIVKPGMWEGFLIGQRLMQIAVAIIFLFLIPKVKTPSSYDTLLFSTLFVFFVTLELGAITFDNDYILYVFFDIIVMISLYASGILSLKLSFILCLYHSVVTILIILLVKNLSLHGHIILILTYGFSNGAGILLAISHHRGVRQEFLLKSSLRDSSFQLKNLAYRDSLTNALNRRAFQEHFSDFKRMVDRIKNDDDNLYLIAADIDYFKSINDSFGHDVGDRVLVAFTKLLESQIRPQDNVYRFGGEEFTILFLGCSRDIVINRVERIISMLNESCLNVEELDRPVTCSFGITPVDVSDTVDAVCIRADKALYKAKNNGRNQFIFQSVEQ